MRKALIFGISGQDGSYLTEYLESLGYEVYGTLRRHSVAESQDIRIVQTKAQTFYADVTDVSSVMRVMHEVKPDEIYNLAGQSQVRISFDKPHFTLQVNAIGVLNILESMRMLCPTARFYQASSSEMFGNSIDSDGYQREQTPMHPVSPYGIAKLTGFKMVQHYRRAYKLFAANGILFNHSSVRRGTNFVEQKIAKTVIEISYNLAETLSLGELYSSRDWGYSPDYVRAMHAILQQPSPDDFVVATGQTVNVQQLLEYAFKWAMNMDDGWSKYLRLDHKYMRPEELKELRGDSSKARAALKWAPTKMWEEIMDELLCHWALELKQRRPPR